MARKRDIFEKLEPKSGGQERLKAALLSGKDLVGVFGPTGTGKSLFSIAYGISSVAKGKYKRLVLSRPIIDVVTGREVTLLGEPEKYKSIASEYLVDIIPELAEGGMLGELMSAGKLMLSDPHFLRGRTFDDSLIVLDDAQSVPPEVIVEIVTRLGRNSRLIVAGDPIFQRSMEPGKDGASLAREILSGEETAEVVDLGIKDIVRPGARRGVRLLLELQMRKRVLSDEESRVLEACRIHAGDADVITVVDLKPSKEKWDVAGESVPDALIVVKEGHLGRLIGIGGERIQAVEGETGLRLRAVQHTLDLKEYIKALHPVTWIHKHIEDFDFVGHSLLLSLDRRHFGPLLGQRGSYIRFIDEVMRKLIGVGVQVAEAGQARRARKRR